MWCLAIRKTKFFQITAFISKAPISSNPATRWLVSFSLFSTSTNRPTTHTFSPRYHKKTNALPKRNIQTHTHTQNTTRERERERWGRNKNCVRQRDQLSLREDTDLSGIRVRSRRFSIHKLRAEFRCDVARTISPAGAAIARLLLGNHGAAVARRGASSALSFSHL